MNIMEGAGGEVIATVCSDDINYLVCRADEDIKEIKRILQEEVEFLRGEIQIQQREYGALKDHADYLEHGVREWREETMRLRELYMHISGCVVCRDRGWKKCGIAGMLQEEQ